MAGAKSTGKSTKKRGNHKNLKAPWKPGESGNPAGRRKGQRDYRTLYWIALQRIAEAKDSTPEEIEEMLQVSGLTKALKGDFYFWSEINNRIHGKSTDKLDITSGGRTLADLITRANGKAEPGGGA